MKYLSASPLHKLPLRSTIDFNSDILIIAVFHRICPTSVNGNFCAYRQFLLPSSSGNTFVVSTAWSSPNICVLRSLQH